MRDHSTHTLTSSATLQESRTPAGPPWKRLAETAGLLNESGRLSSTIFEEMSALAVAHDAINLGQGFPDTDGPEVLSRALAEAVSGGKNQYATIAGSPDLRGELAEHEALNGRRRPDPDSEITVTAGATEALSASMLAFLSPGDEVILFEPFYDLYPAMAGLTGARIVTVPLAPPEFRPDPVRLREAFSDRTRMIVVNDPHNPTGTVLDPSEMSQIAELAREHDAIILTDSVYEHLAFDAPSTDPATTDAGRDRTIRVSSASKTFSITGWRVGWAIAPPELTRGLRVTKGYLSHSAAAPLQAAVAEALRWARQSDFYDRLRAQYEDQRKILLDGLGATSFDAVSPTGTFFSVASTENVPDSWGRDGTEISERLTANAGVAVVPLQAFATPENRHLYTDWVRFAFCKRPEVLRQATQRLSDSGL